MDINNFGKLVESKIKEGLDPFAPALNFMNTESEKQLQASREKEAASIAVEEIVVGDVQSIEEQNPVEEKKETEDFVL